MRSFKRFFITTTLVACLAGSLPAAAIVIGQMDTFEDGTTQNWVVALAGLGNHPNPPVNVPTGGPLGATDNYLQLTSLGGSDTSSPNPGIRLTVINIAQWAGNYTAAGVTRIAMDLRNLGTTDLNIRLYLENPIPGPPTDTAISDAVPLPAGGGWTHVEFAIDGLSLTELTGDVDALLTNVTALRIVHSPFAVFPGLPISAVLGVDNIAARDAAAVAVSEPAALTLFGVGLAGLLALRTRRALSSAARRQ